MKTLLAALLLSTAAVAADAIPLHTVAPETARFEILETSRWTFKLDRNSGEVWQLTWLDDGRKTWTAMTVPGLDAGKKSKARFQLYGSGLARQMLLDTETGATWWLDEKKDAAGKDSLAWVQLGEPAAKK